MSRMYGHDANKQDEKESKEKPVNESRNELHLVKTGSVTEISLGDKTFQVVDPSRLEQTIKILEQHEEGLYKIRQRVKEQSTVINRLVQEISDMKNEIQKLREISNGYGSNELSNY